MPHKYCKTFGITSILKSMTWNEPRSYLDSYFFCAVHVIGMKLYNSPLHSNTNLPLCNYTLFKCYFSYGTTGLRVLIDWFIFAMPILTTTQIVLLLDFKNWRNVERNLWNQRWQRWEIKYIFVERPVLYSIGHGILDSPLYLHDIHKQKNSIRPIFYLHADNLKNSAATINVVQYFCVSSWIHLCDLKNHVSLKYIIHIVKIGEYSDNLLVKYIQQKKLYARRWVFDHIYEKKSVC